MDEILKELYENKMLDLKQAKALKFASPGERMNIAKELWDSKKIDRETAEKLQVAVEDVTGLENVAVQDRLQTPGLPEEQKGPEDPLKLAQDYAKEMNIPLEEAYQETATWPRRTRSFLEGKESHVLPVMGDLMSGPGRALDAAIFGNDDVLGNMSRVDANPMTAEGEERGFLPMMASGMLKDPSLPLTPFTGAGALGLASKIPALMTGSRAANIGRNALAGGMASIGETFIEQQTRPEGYPKLSLGDYATIGGLGSGMGGAMGAFQKARPNIGPVEEPGALKINRASPRQQQKEFLKEAKNIKKEGSLKGVDVENINPLYRQDFFSPSTDLDIPYEQYAKVAQSKMSPNLQAGAPRSKSSLEFAVDEVAAPAFEAYKKATQKVGAEIGAVRKELLPKIEPIPKDKFIGMVNDGMDDDIISFGRELVDNEEVIFAVNKLNGERIPTAELDEDTFKILKSLGSLGEDINGGSLRLFQKKISKLIPMDPVSKQRIDTEASRSFIGIDKMAKEAIDSGIEKTAGKDVAQYFRRIRSEYGPMRDNVKELGSQLGKSINFSPSKFGEEVVETPIKGFKKGEGAISRILQSKQSQGAKFLWDEVRAETGFNVPKAAAYALQAGEEAGDVTTRSLLDQMGGIEKAIPKIGSGRGLIQEGLVKAGKKGIEVASEFKNPSQGRGIRAAAANLQQANPTSFQVPNMNLGMFSGRGIIDQPIAEEAIFPYMLGEETK